MNFFSFVEVLVGQMDLHLLDGRGAEVAVVAGDTFRGRRTKNINEKAVHFKHTDINYGREDEGMDVRVS